ncbi:5-hydroxytryptamine receptor 2 [Aplysia californica]|uniref:5-hydroxytryptamine receptor 2 n=1 Tax=Aplysia californica TaxID=6500 RepID=A0ABM0JZN6_APLCA|nr:5-hydroxytryptamine receptor 2 [Aplysia californica]
MEEIKTIFKDLISDKVKNSDAHTFSFALEQTLGDNRTSNPKPECLFDVHFIYSVIYSLFCFYIPCPLMLRNYLRLFLIAKKHHVRIKNLHRLHQNQGTQGSKAARTLTIITGTFLACWLPFFIINPIAAADEHLIPLECFMVTIWLRYFNSCVNPIIYGTSNSKFRAAFQRLLRCRSVKSTVSSISPAASVYKAFSWIRPSLLDGPPSAVCDTGQDENRKGGGCVTTIPTESHVIISEEEIRANVMLSESDTVFS